MFDLAIDSKLRGCDSVKIRIREVVGGLASAHENLNDLQGTGNICAIQILLGHSKIDNTVRYLGVDVEDALLLAERTQN